MESVAVGGWGVGWQSGDIDGIAWPYLILNNNSNWNKGHQEWTA